MIFETHAHYDDRKFDSDRVELLSHMREKGIETIINVGADMRGSWASVELANKWEFVYASVGVHPDEVESLTEEDYKELYDLTKHKKVVAVGEIGLDYNGREASQYREVQQKHFKRQLELAKSVNLPVIIHSRDASQETFDILKEYDNLKKGIIHCFSGSASLAKEYVKRGWLLGIGGVVTFKNGRVLKEVVETIPIEHLVLETDSPYLAPMPHRGERNDSGYIPLIVTEISKLKKIPEEDIIEITRQTAKKLFGV